MTSIVLCFQLHQPYRLNRYSVFHRDPFYFDDARNEQIIRKVAEKCYRPATSLVLDLVRRHAGRFRVACSLSGTILEQLERWAPDVIDLFRRLAETGRCEFLGETYYHSLASVYSPAEFAEQVRLHARRIESLFGRAPRVFRNTELIYSDRIAGLVAGLRAEDGRPQFEAMLAEGVDAILGARSPDRVYRSAHAPASPGERPLALLLRNHRLSDGIAFRFSDRRWAEWPLTPEKIAAWIRDLPGRAQVCNLFMDYETFGEHQWRETGILEFLARLPDAVFDLPEGGIDFATPGEVIERYEPAGAYGAPEHTSWADTERDLSAWCGNAMQTNALDEFYRLEATIRRALEAARIGGDEEAVLNASYLIEDWRKLSTSDHFYYMCTKCFADGDVHAYFNPYDSPYDSYINFMNVLDNLRDRITALRPRLPDAAPGADASPA